MPWTDEKKFLPKYLSLDLLGNFHCRTWVIRVVNFSDTAPDHAVLLCSMAVSFGGFWLDPVFHCLEITGIFVKRHSIMAVEMCLAYAIRRLKPSVDWQKHLLDSICAIRSVLHHQRFYVASARFNSIKFGYRLVVRAICVRIWHARSSPFDWSHVLKLVIA